MKYQIEMLSRAIAELRSIVIWLAEHHPSEQAGRWLIGIEAAIAGLANDPEQHCCAIEADNFPFEVPKLHYGMKRRRNHRVVFATRENVVRIYSVRHLGQDLLLSSKG